LGFPTGWLFTTHKDCLLRINLAQSASFLGAIKRSSFFSGAVAGEEVQDFCEGSFCTHILYFVIALLYFIYFTCIILYQKPKKIRILGSCYFFTFSLSC
jgi:hypothetical protein